VRPSGSCQVSDLPKMWCRDVAKTTVTPRASCGKKFVVAFTSGRLDLAMEFYKG
jgi:hypothetical protein